MSGPPGAPPILSRAGVKPGSFGLTGSAGLQLKPAAGKKFGLNLAKPKKPAPTASAFAGALDDELDDDASERARVARELARGGGGSTVSRAAALATQKAALDEDASAFDYDGVYDQMQQDRSAVRQGVKPAEEKKAKYITSIMKTHQARELENEKVFERKMQKEAEAEAHLYGDKEKFMTSAYRKKIAAREDYEAELKQQEAEESRNDVTKRDGLGHFYANLLDGRLAGDVSNKPAATASDKPAATASDKPAATASDKFAATASDKPAATASEARPAGTSNETAATSGGGASASASGGGGGGDDSDRDGKAPPASSGLVPASLADSISQAVSALGSQAAAAAPAPAAAAATVSHERRNDGDAVLSARERYLARKRQREEEGA